MARMGLFRLAILVLAAVGIWSLVANGAGAALAGVGALFILPLLLFKLFFLFMIFGFLGRAVGGGRHRQPPWHGRREANAADARSDESRFEDWHRMAHAREEVDSWTPEL